MQRTHKRKIVCAAVKLGGIVLPCIRHWDIGCHVLADSIWGIDVQNLIRQGQEEQGFIDNEGQFLDRKQAAILYNSYSRKYDEKDFHYILADGTVMGKEPAHKYKLKWSVK